MSKTIVSKTRLRTSTDILRILEKTADDLFDNVIDNERSRAFVYLCNTASSVIKNHELEKRIEELEKQVEGDN